jgi:hypothetical protein
MPTVRAGTAPVTVPDEYGAVGCGGGSGAGVRDGLSGGPRPEAALSGGFDRHLTVSRFTWLWFSRPFFPRPFSCRRGGAVSCLMIWL